jgi:signal transduction histidine kinase
MLACADRTAPLPAGAEERLGQFADLAAAAIANADKRAKLKASRARVVAAADQSRRRLRRDVHDGAQQRLVQSIITLKIAKDALARGRPVEGLIDESLALAERASGDLRDIVRGILPASLTSGGLRSGVEALTIDLPLPVEVDIDVPRLAPAIETTAYFFVAEALTNVVKHARAESAQVRGHVAAGTLVIEVADDGIGGADGAAGSGLNGLYDRIEAAEGTLAVASPRGGGTALRACLPLGTPPPPG